MADTPGEEPAGLPRELRFLKALVTVLTAAMILGVITVVALLVIRLNAAPRPILAVPELYDLPPGAEITGYSLAGDRVVIVSDDGMIRVFPAEGGGALQEYPVRPPAP